MSVDQTTYMYVNGMSPKTNGKMLQELHVRAKKKTVFYIRHLLLSEHSRLKIGLGW